jgi:hypothetical protein
MNALRYAHTLLNSLHAQQQSSLYYPSPSDNGMRDHSQSGMGMGSISGPTVNQVKPNRYAYASKGTPMRSSLLEEFRNSKNNKKFELKVKNWRALLSSRILLITL